MKVMESYKNNQPYLSKPLEQLVNGIKQSRRDRNIPDNVSDISGYSGFSVPMLSSNTLNTLANKINLTNSYKQKSYHAARATSPNFTRDVEPVVSQSLPGGVLYEQAY